MTFGAATFSALEIESEQANCDAAKTDYINFISSLGRFTNWHLKIKLWLSKLLKCHLARFNLKTVIRNRRFWKYQIKSWTAQHTHRKCQNVYEWWFGCFWFGNRQLFRLMVIHECALFLFHHWNYHWLRRHFTKNSKWKISFHILCYSRQGSKWLFFPVYSKSTQGFVLFNNPNKEFVFVVLSLRN